MNASTVAGPIHTGRGRSMDGSPAAEALSDRSGGLDTGFTRLVRQHRAQLLRRCVSRLGDFDDAEDALQEAFLKAYRAAAGFEGRSAMRTWLVAIVDNECVSQDRRRRRHRLSSRLRQMIRSHEVALRGDGGVDTAGLWAALDRLPGQARQVLALRFFRDASLEETSRAMGIGLSAAKMRIHRAVDQLRRHYPVDPDVGVVETEHTWRG